MRRNRLGKSGIVASDMCMGTVTLGTGSDQKASFEILDMAYDAGINVQDTAEMYPVPPDKSYAGEAKKCLVAG